MSKKYQNTKYYVGLDIGTSSVGWAVTDANYELLKVNGHKTWGSRLFTEAETALERRTHRATRRRLQRRKQRLDLLDELFAEELAKVDPQFLLRLKESQYHMEDKSTDDKYVLFNDQNRTDGEFFTEYPTIYHLRSELMQGKKEDIRAVYLALHHIVKYRGHFLLPGDNYDMQGNLSELIKRLFKFIEETLFIEDLGLTDEIQSKIEEILLTKTKTRLDRQKEIVKLFNTKHQKLDDKQKKLLEAIFKLCLGLKGNMVNIFGDKGEYGIDFTDVEDKKKKVEFSADYDNNINDYVDFFGEYFELLEITKKINDTVIFSEILVDGKGFSESKVISYEKHQQDLRKLKTLLKSLDKTLGYKYGEGLYQKILLDDVKSNYVNYSGNSQKLKKCTKDEFYGFIKSKLNSVTKKEKVSEAQQKEIAQILADMEFGDYLPLQRTTDNGVIPNQLHKKELIEIIEQQTKYHDFFNDVDENGLTIKDKIISLMTFRIPYYVGPLNDYHKVADGTGHAWIEKKKDGKIYPWNFDEMVDTEATAEKFIKNLTNKCTYLKGEDVLPKESKLYSEFMLLNELNNIKIDNQKLDPKLKMKMVSELFMKKNEKITKKKIVDYLRSIGQANGNEMVSGIDREIKSDLKTIHKIQHYYQDASLEMAENIIRWNTIFNDSTSDILKDKITKAYGDVLTPGQIKGLSNLACKDWGKLSEKFLTGIRCDVGEFKNISIIQAMRDTNNNLMELLSNKYEFMDKIQEYNKEYYGDFTFKAEPSIMDDLYVGPGPKRAIWQAVRIVEEIKRIMGHDPEKIFLETTRTNRAPKVKNTKRYDALEKKYESVKEHEYAEVKKEFEIEKNDSLNIKKLFLYFTQLGHCMYSDEKIPYNELFTNRYDIDHIYPRSKTRDNSMDNLVLVKAECNRDKKDNYPIKLKTNIQQKCQVRWAYLRDKKLITEEKYNRLVRKTPLTEDELSQFIARQLVFTSQSVKATAEVFKRLYEDSKICYVKAENVSDFRYGSTRKMSKDDQPQPFIKNRDVNDFHHAKDAYLNIVVGNVYDVKFTQNPTRFIKANKDYSLNYIFRYPVNKKGENVWDPEQSMKIVEKTLKSNDVRVTKLVKPITSPISNETLHKALKCKPGSYLPRKSSKGTPLADVTKYGGYEKIKNAYYSIYKYTYMKKKECMEEFLLVPIPIHLVNNDEELPKYINDKIAERAKKKKLETVECIVKELYQGTLVRINGYDYRIAGSSGKQFELHNGINLIVEPWVEKVLKETDKFVRKSNSKLDKKQQKENTTETLIEKQLNDVFEYLCRKLNQGIFKNNKHTLPAKLLGDSIQKRFEDASIEDEFEVIKELISAIAKNPQNFKTIQKVLDISGSSIPRFNLKLTKNNVDEFIIKNESVTGLFTHEKVIFRK
ncbi:type II CRISPR RNA-guided endonuclease Cas9 [Ligilactobacillus ceti]|uniref:CRISPR-associated endonuclease Cas9 n=1 Tax=Ligilactobacillus ceti DSM 22408 TaxID=1122146 RepID=A0A0R2KGU9_9LACO|nr:type II CRISPR RNA-guided endonuclease Cas9 [Ligilactobacillus ceti]KRN88591.1 CRISPR-associated protein, Csn1 family [Ligilactobacillus ceti DSM 22408]